MNEMRLSLIIGGSNDGAIKALSQVVARAQTAGQSLRSLEVAGNFGKTRAGLTSISEQLARIQSAAVALGSIGFGIKGLSDLAKLSDSYVGSATRIKLATTASSEFAAAQAEVFAIAQRNGQALEATATLYARAARPIREMGRSQADALAVTDAVAASLKISNATTAESASAQLQFAQALGKGVVNGDELNAVLEASPRLAEALAAGLRVPVGALKELGAQGKLTSQAIVAALLAQREALTREAASMDQTIGQATTNLQNAFTKAFGENTSAGAVALARGINALAGNLDVLGQAAAVAGSAVLAVVGVRALTAVAAYTAGKVAAVAAERAAAQAALQTAQANVAAAAAQATHTLNTEALVRAKLQLVAAERTASLAAAGTGVRAGGALLGLVGGPIGLITTALTVGVTAWQLWGDKGQEAAKKPQQSLAELAKELAEFGDRMANDVAVKKYQDLAAAIAAARREEEALREAARQRALADMNIASQAQVDYAVDNDAAVVAKRRERLAAEEVLAKERISLEKKVATEKAAIVRDLVTKEKALNGQIEEDEKKSLERRVKEQQQAAEAVRQAWQRSLEEAAKKRQEADDLRQKAADLGDSVQSRVEAVRQEGMSDAERQRAQANAQAEAGQKALDARQRASYELTNAYSAQLAGNLEKSKTAFNAAEKDLQRAFTLAEKAKDANLMEEIGGRLQDVENARAANAEKEAAQLDQQAESQREKLLELEAMAESLRNKLAAMEVDIKIDAAVAKVTEWQARLEAIPKVITTELKVTTSGAGAADIPADQIPGRAFGGPIPGRSPHDRADNILIRATAGEWMLDVPTVRHYGSDFLRRLMSRQIPRFAYGGPIGGLRVPSVASPAASGSGMAPMVLDFGKLGRFNAYAARGTMDDLKAMFGREALRKGGGG